MKLREWFALRGMRYVAQRGAILLGRYGLTPGQAMARVEGLVSTMAEYGCAPTFPTPGRVVESHPRFIRRVQDAGAEIAVHGYDHLDLGAYSASEAAAQLVRASQVFARLGLETRGFRCPYLRSPDGLQEALPEGLFGYGSNWAVFWDAALPTGGSAPTSVLDVLQGFYRPASAAAVACVPRLNRSTVEIPACVPDDLQLHDGLGLSPDGIAQAWSRVLRQTYERGELFDLLIHPELAWLCQPPLSAVLQEARRLTPAVWIARLGDISDWWREKASFRVHVTALTAPYLPLPSLGEGSGVRASPAPPPLRLTFDCSSRATVLIRDLGGSDDAQPWYGRYSLLRARFLEVAAAPWPFLGLPGDAPESVVAFLEQQGYVVRMGAEGERCAVVLRPDQLAFDEVGLVEAIEASPGPLVRYWRWPEGARSALCVSGDLDALTLFDYASRLFVR